MEKWQLIPGVVELPSGRRVRGRSWREDSDECADLTVLLIRGDYEAADKQDASRVCGEKLIIDWPDLRLPRRTAQAVEQLKSAWERAASERVEIACKGGVGRTGTAIAIMALFEGMSAKEAIEWTKTHYNAQAVTSHAQRAFVMDLGLDAA